MVGCHDDGPQEAVVSVALDGGRGHDRAVRDVPPDHAEIERRRRAVEWQARVHQERLDGRNVRVGRPLELHQQHPPPPQQPSLAIARSPRGVRSMSGIASAGLVALTIALTIPSATSWVGISWTSDQADGSEAGRELRDGQRARDTARVRAAFRALGRREAILRDDVGDAHPAARPQDAGDLAEHGRLVGREVDRRSC